MMKPIHKVGLGIGALLLVLLVGSKKASAATGPSNGGGGGGGLWPPTPFRAVVIVPRSSTLPNGGVKVRRGPGTNNPEVGPEGQPGNDAFTDTFVTVQQTGVSPTDGQGGEWWLVQPDSGGQGYVRAIDAQGVNNLAVAS